MNISEAIYWGSEKLSQLKNPKLEAEVLLSAVLEKDRVFVKTFVEKELEVKEFILYKKFIQKRSKSIPVAQILGYQYWNEFKILVDENVLIPRDETEILSLEIKKYLEKQKKENLKILDIGTGSGCISIFLKHYFPNSQVSGIDISQKALKIAQKNKKIQNLDIEFFYSDLFSNIKDGSKFDVMVANLPYVPSELKVSLEVKKEPALALFSGKDGLVLIRRLANELKMKNIIFQVLFLEFLPSQKEKIETIFHDKKITFLSDVGGDVFFAKIEELNTEIL